MTTASRRETPLKIMIMKRLVAGWLSHVRQKARQKAKRNIPLKMVKIRPLQGEILRRNMAIRLPFTLYVKSNLIAIFLLKFRPVG